ncbi:hypothetical protein RB653_004368 [Dictyostelium firmibasis]|uniref:RING-type domain-containing protein n=1 Tax=Dictyostelium firmibasis TaxID=79012 RepID=A0AAN7U0U9_9MYCE
METTQNAINNNDHINSNHNQHQNIPHPRDEKLHPHVNDPGHAEFDAMITIIIAVVVIVLQLLLFFWKTKYNRSFIKVSLIGIWLFPLAFSLYNGFIRMITIWSCFTGVLGYLYFLSTRQPLSRKTPKIVFMWFYLIYLFSFGLSLVAGILIFFNIFGFSFDARLTLLSYGLYIGLLGRDFAEVCSDRIASILGLGVSRLPFTQIPDNYCAICTTNLKPIGSNSSNNSLLISDMTDINNNVNRSKNNSDGDQKKEIEKKVDKIMNFIFSEKPTKLPCDHMFHEWCIRGWMLVGKKNTCPHCNEKVDFKTLSENPWQNNTSIWGTLLDSVRHLIVWNPILLGIANVIISLSHKF